MSSFNYVNFCLVFSCLLIRQSYCQSVGSCQNHHNLKAPSGKVLVEALEATGVEEVEVVADAVVSAVGVVEADAVVSAVAVVAVVEHLVVVADLVAEVQEDEAHPEEVVADVGNFSLYVIHKHTHLCILRKNKYHLFVYCVFILK